MTEPLRALSVRQPWVIAICHGKNVENRPKPTHYRGLVAIHASKAADDSIDARTIAWISHTIGLSIEEMLTQDHRGAVVAVAQIVGCHLHGDRGAPCDTADAGLCSPWAARGRWHWQLANVRVLPRPVSASGALGLWRLSPGVDAAVRGLLPAS